MELFLDFMAAFMEFMSYFNTATTEWPDYNGDGWCGAADLIEFLSTFTPVDGGELTQTATR